MSPVSEPFVGIVMGSDSDWPVMEAAASEARKPTREAISSGSAKRPIGMSASSASRYFASIARIGGVATVPGATALAVIPYRAPSSASVRVSPVSADFAAA